MLKYIVDFYCRDLQLVIEIDGPVHDLQVRYDDKRQFELEQLGLNFLRFSNREVNLINSCIKFGAYARRRKMQL